MTTDKATPAVQVGVDEWADLCINDSGQVYWNTSAPLCDMPLGRYYAAPTATQPEPAPDTELTAAPREVVVDEMKELLHSAHEIALRGGADTNWEALARGIAKIGIGPITARHYFAKDTPRETIIRHLDELLAPINAALRPTNDGDQHPPTTPPCADGG